MTNLTAEQMAEALRDAKWWIEQAFNPDTPVPKMARALLVLQAENERLKRGLQIISKWGRISYKEKGDKGETWTVESSEPTEIARHVLDGGIYNEQ